MSNQLQKSLENLNRLFLNYCTEVEQNVHLAVQSFMKTESNNVQVVIEKDKETQNIDSLDMKIFSKFLSHNLTFQFSSLNPTQAKHFYL